MNCLVCQKNLDELTPLCADHAPAWGKALHVGDTTIIAGEMRLRDAIVAKIMRRHLIRWWLGSDVWLLWAFPYGRGKYSVVKFRLKHLIARWLVDENWFDSKRLLLEYAAKFGMARCTEKHHILGMLCERVKKIPHSGVNIAFYCPENCDDYQRELYGIDLIQKFIAFYHEVNWIRLNGSIDMQKVYPILDAYIRPTRHDGGSRLIRECRLNKIPFYWSDDGNPNLEEMSNFVEIVRNKCCT